MSRVCLACNARVYPLEWQIIPNNNVCHKGCLRCAKCQRTLTTSNCRIADDMILCQKDFQDVTSNPAYAKEKEEKRIQDQIKREEEEERRRKEEEKMKKQQQLEELKKDERRNRILKLVEDLQQTNTVVSENKDEKEIEQEWNLAPSRFLATLFLEKSIYSSTDSLRVTAHFFNAHSLIALSTQSNAPIFQNLSFKFEILNGFRSCVCKYSLVNKKNLSNYFIIIICPGFTILWKLA